MKLSRAGLAVLAVLAAGAILVAVVGAPAQRPGATASVAATGTPGSPAGSQAVIPSNLTAIGHIYVIVMENKESSDVLGNADAPYFNSLVKRYSVALGYAGVAHPSQPNYLALFSGSTQGVTDDAVHTITGARTLADEIEASGRSWHVAAENYPGGCYTDYGATDGADGPGTYARKHNPAISFAEIATNPARCGLITDLSHFDPNLGNYWLVAPNMCHDMHDCSVSAGDAFLGSFLPKILGSAAFQRDGLIFLTFDEGTSDTRTGGKVATVIISPKAKAGMESYAHYNHYSLLRTIEEAWKLPCLGHACNAQPMVEFFQ